jgi:hypothetical protein
MSPLFANLASVAADVRRIIKQEVIHFDFDILLKQFKLAISQYFTHIKYLDSACPL